MLRNLFKNGNITYLSNERKYNVDNHHSFLKKKIKLVPAFNGTHCIGTNDITENIETISTLHNCGKENFKKSASTTISVSSVVIRHDKNNIEKAVSKLNNDLKHFCEDNLIHYLCNDNIVGLKQQNVKCKFTKYNINT